MATYNLDLNEEIDTMTINSVEYEVGDIPVAIIRKIMAIKTGFFKKDVLDQWKPICKEILELRNKDVNIDSITKEKMFAFITYIQWKIQKWQVW